MAVGADARGTMRDSGRAEVAARLHAVAIHLLRRLRREDAASGLTAARLSALSVLVFGGSRTAGELAAAEQVSAPTMTRLLKGLEADGYVVREPNPADRRSVVVTATARARAALETARGRRVEHLLEVLGGLTAEEWDGLGATVSSVERALRRD